MMPKRLKLNNLNVKSFVTKLEDDEKSKLHGGLLSYMEKICMTDTCDCGGTGGTGGTGVPTAGCTYVYNSCAFTCGGRICDATAIPHNYC